MMLDYSSRTSDKIGYAAPTRGAQGNALKTLIGMPFAFGVKDRPVVIRAGGHCHKILPSSDPSGEVRIDHDLSDCEARGTCVEITLPAEECEYPRRSFRD